MGRKNSKLNREALKQFLEELMAKKFSKEQLLHYIKNYDVENEVCIEPFAYLDADGDVIPYTELQKQEFAEFADLVDLEMCPGIEINEKEILYEEEVQLDKEELETIKNIADQIEPIEAGICIQCVVNGEGKYLIDNVNCNIKEVSILGLSLLTPLNLKILKVTIDSEMESEEEIEVALNLEVDGNLVTYKFYLGVLVDAGIVSVVDNDTTIAISPVEYRGIMKQVSMEELAELLIM
jgi:hypothetical protein